jgi:hypothetical protein
MALASKLLGIWLTERAVTSTTPLFMRLLGAMAAIAILAAMASALLALAIGGVLWVAYLQLLAYGMAPQMAMISMIGIVLILLAILVIFVQDYINQIRALSHRIIAGHGPITGGVSSVANAFVDGLMAGTPR